MISQDGLAEASAPASRPANPEAESVDTPARCNWWFVMGPSGTGKTTIGKELSRSLDGVYIEGDDLHPQENVDKMSRGTPLKDDDRWPWFDIIGAECLKWLNQKGDIVVACSALKRSYRDYLRNAAQRADSESPGVRVKARFVFLNAPTGVAEERVRDRKGHFMPAGLVKNQYNVLELPTPDEVEADVICVEAEFPKDQVARDAVAKVRAVRAAGR